MGAAYNAYGHENASMGVDCGDYDNDGRLDFYMTAYQSELPVLYRNTGDGLLEDVTLLTGAGEGALAYVNWGTGLVDFDNDGDRDIFIANGHTEDNIELRDKTTTYRARNILLMNTGDGKFVNVSDSSGDGLLPVYASRGTGFDDLDNDGDADAVILNIRQEPTILRNDSPTANHWLQIQLRGVKTNRDGVGARVRVVAEDLTQVDEVHSGRGYQSHWGWRLQFGLGKRHHVDRIEVLWIGGGVDVVEDVAVGQTVTITEGGESRPTKLGVGAQNPIEYSSPVLQCVGRGARREYSAWINTTRERYYAMASTLVGPRCVGSHWPHECVHYTPLGCRARGGAACLGLWP
jgi:hypothetical protein